MSLTTEFDDGLMILDGGLATELERRGQDVTGPLWSAEVLRTAPEAIEQLHYDYFAAGARCAISASYQASYEGFAALGLDAEETTALLRRSVELAQSARARYRRDHPADRRQLYVAASVGPYGAISHDGAEYRGDYGLTKDQLIAFHARRFEVLATSGADFLACETIPLLDEALALATLLGQYPDVLAWMSFTSADGMNTAHGESLTDCARLLDRVRQRDRDRSELRETRTRRRSHSRAQGRHEQGHRRVPEFRRALGWAVSLLARFLGSRQPGRPRPAVGQRGRAPDRWVLPDRASGNCRAG